MRENQPDLELKTVVMEASRALTRLDSGRLDELARWCESRNEDSRSSKGDELIRQAREAEQEMGVLARVLDATRANVAVMKRLREIHAGKLEYREQALQSVATGNRDGFD